MLQKIHEAQVEKSKAREKERQRFLNVLTQDPVDTFFSYCAQRAKRLPPAIQSVVEMQVQQILFNAENPSMPQQPIMPLPRVEKAGMEHPNLMVSPPRLPTSGMTPQMLMLQPTENPGMEPYMSPSPSPYSPHGITPALDPPPPVQGWNLHPQDMVCGPTQVHPAPISSKVFGEAMTTINQWR